MRKDDDIEITGDEEETGNGGDTLAAYYAENKKDKDNEAVFNHELGLAVEKLPDGLSIEKLWNVI